jgi:NTE family protein
MNKIIPKDKKIGLALGGGAARGWAHVGILRFLSEKDVKVDYIAGTSIGALIGAVFASGNLAELEEFGERAGIKDFLKLVDLVLPRSGLIEGKKIEEFIASLVKLDNIEELKIPFGAVSTDIFTGDEVVLSSGSVVEAVRASIAIPAIFMPVKKGEMVLADGGLVNPVPVDVVRKMGAEFVIAVELNSDIQGRRGLGLANNLASDEAVLDKTLQNERPDIDDVDDKETEHEIIKEIAGIKERFGSIDFKNILPTPADIKGWFIRDKELPNIFEVAMASANIIQTELAEGRMAKDRPELLVRPKLGQINLMDFHCSTEAIQIGYKAMRDAFDAFQE